MQKWSPPLQQTGSRLSRSCCECLRAYPLPGWGQWTIIRMRRWPGLWILLPRCSNTYCGTPHLTKLLGRSGCLITNHPSLSSFSTLLTLLTTLHPPTFPLYPPHLPILPSPPPHSTLPTSPFYPPHLHTLPSPPPHSTLPTSTLYPPHLPTLSSPPPHSILHTSPLYPPHHLPTLPPPSPPPPPPLFSLDCLCDMCLNKGVTYIIYIGFCFYHLAEYFRVVKYSLMMSRLINSWGGWKY